MNKLSVTLILVLLISFFAPKNTKADVNIAGGIGSNLTIERGVVTTDKESILINLYNESADVEQDYMFQNKTTILQKVMFGFAYQQGSDSGVSDIHILVDNASVDFNSDQVSGENNQTHLITFPVNFTRGQIREVKITHKQINSANFRGLRSFSYNLKDKFQRPIGEFDLTINLMDGITLNSFNKTLNPDLNLTLEPIGWTQNGSTLNWSWQNFNPGFDILANFYLPNSDLARIKNLNQSQGNSVTNQFDSSPVSSNPVKVIQPIKPFWQQFLINLWRLPIKFLRTIF